MDATLRKQWSAWQLLMGTQFMQDMLDSGVKPELQQINGSGVARFAIRTNSASLTAEELRIIKMRVGKLTMRKAEYGDYQIAGGEYLENMAMLNGITSIAIAVSISEYMTCSADVCDAEAGITDVQLDKLVTGFLAGDIKLSSCEVKPTQHSRCKSILCASSAAHGENWEGYCRACFALMQDELASRELGEPQPGRGPETPKR